MSTVPDGNNRRAGLAIATLMLVLATTHPAPATAAELGCRNEPLRAAFERAESVFVATIESAQADNLLGGFLVRARVEEIWRGPDLSPIVFINDHGSRAQPRGGERYLYIATQLLTIEHVGVPGEPDGLADSATLDPCRPPIELTAEVDVERPADVRYADGFEPPNRGPDVAGVAGWALIGVGVGLVVLTGWAALRGRRLGIRA